MNEIARQGLVKIVAACGSVGITEQSVKWHRLEREFKAARRAGLIRSAGFEASGMADDYLNTTEGRAAVAAARKAMP